MKRMALIVLFLFFATSAIFAQDDPTPFAVGDVIDITIPRGSLLLYEIELDNDQSYVIDWQGDAGTSFFAVRKSDQQILIGANFTDQLRAVPPSDDVYLFELSNNNNASAEISLTITAVPSQTIGFGETVSLDELFVDLYFEVDAGDYVLFEPENSFYSLEAYSEEFDEWHDVTVSNLGLSPIPQSTGWYFSDTGQYRVVIHSNTFSEDSDNANRRFSLVQVDPEKSEIAVGEVSDDSADNTFVEYTIILEEYQHIRVLSETPEGSQIEIYNADDIYVNFEQPHSLSTPRIAYAELIAPEAGEYTIRIINPLKGDIFDSDYRLSVMSITIISIDDESMTVDYKYPHIYLEKSLIPEQEYILSIQVEGEQSDSVDASITVFDDVGLPIFGVRMSDGVAINETFTTDTDGLHYIQIAPARDYDSEDITFTITITPVSG